VTVPPPVLLLVREAAVLEAIHALADAREGAGPPVLVTEVEGNLAEAIARAIKQSKGQPLGVIATTHAEVIEAIEDGADDGCVAAGLDLDSFVAFVDRVLLRAWRRRDFENARADALHGEKLAVLGTLVASVAHEINNPLAVVVLMWQSLRSRVETLLRAQREISRLASREGPATAEELRELEALVPAAAGSHDVETVFDDGAAALDTIRDIVRGLRIYAHGNRDEILEPVDIPDLIDQVVRLVVRAIATDAVLEKDYEQDLPTLLLPRTKLTQVITNLLLNAAQAISQVKRPIHRVRVSARCDEESLAISVSDTGPGIPPENIERIFDPFFSSKRFDGSVGGSGLGLSISRSILQGVGGDLVAESVHGQGATFIAIFPIAGRRVQRVEPSERAMAPTEAPASQGRRGRLLVVDDDERILKSVALALHGRYDVTLAGDGQEAIDLLSSGSGPDAVLSDVSMPIVDGPALYDWLRRERPALATRLVFMTASVYDAQAQRAAKTGRPLLEKPFTRERVLSVLREVARGR